MANGTNYPSGLSVSTRVKSQVNRVLKTKMIRINFGDGTTETDTAFDLPSNGFVRDVWINVITAESTGGTTTIDIGLLASESGGDADGFADALSVAATGIVRPQSVATVGLNITYLSANTRGVLLSQFGVGTDLATDNGFDVEVPHIMGSVTARSVSWTPGSNDFAELVADIAIVYEEIRVDTSST